jgi:L-ascorbate metabolism protein UlaG (beta-lactamase superfamily)
MKITQIRNATLILHWEERHVLVDPMLSPQGAMLPFRWVARRRQRNPVVGLPAGAGPALDQITHGLITHCRRGHYDHLDRAGISLFRERGIPVFCSQRDAGHLRRRGIDARPLALDRANPFFTGTIHLVPCRHGRGWVGSLMEHGVGYVIDLPGEPKVYLSGDTVLTDAVRDAIRVHRPDLVIVHAGAAQLDVGQPILMAIEEVLDLVRLAPGRVIANHMEALDHCPVTREQLRAQAESEGLAETLLIPADGEVLVFPRASPP